MSKKQTVAIAVMAAIGLLLAAIMLWPRGGSQDAHAEHGEHGEHGEPRGHAEAGSAAASATASGARPAAAHTELETVALNDAQIKAAGIVLAAAGPAQIATIFTLPGEIHFNEDRTAHVVPKLSGVVTAVHADLGQSVKRGQVLAVIASSGLSDQRSELLTAQRRLAMASATLERERKLWQDKISAEQDYLQAKQAMNEAEIAVQNAYQKLSAVGVNGVSSAQLNQLELRAPFDGVVMEKHLALGEAVKEDANVFTISDLKTVWVEIAVPPKDLHQVRVGDTVTVKASAFEAQASGKIAYLGALLGEQTRTAKARVVLANPQSAWRPGLFVNVDVHTGMSAAAVTVATDAIQTVDDKPSVFVKTASGFRVQPVTPGRSDGKLTEVLQGLKTGEQYAAVGSFVVKAELGKGSAEHAH